MRRIFQFILLVLFSVPAFGQANTAGNVLYGITPHAQYWTQICDHNLAAGCSGTVVYGDVSVGGGYVEFQNVPLTAGVSYTLNVANSFGGSGFGISFYNSATPSGTSYVLNSVLQAP